MTLSRFFTLALSTLLLLVFTFSSCQKDKANETPEPQQVTEETKYYTPSLGDFVTDRSGYWTEIPAGSVDALNQAIAEADAGGVIYLKAGVHTETDRVTVNKRVAIIGEDGAVLKVTSVDTSNVVYPAIHVLNAPNTLVKNLEIEPVGTSGWCGVMFENSPGSALLSSKVSVFAFGILIQNSDRVAVIGNQFLNSGRNGIMAMNGKSTYLANNHIEGSTYNGIWANDEWGTAEGNVSINNGGGMLLCNFSELFGLLTPDGSPLFAGMTCTGWKVRNNTFSNSGEGVGLTITDSAHYNYIENNEYAGNSLYDVNLTPDIDYGFLFLPASYKNTVNEASSVKIKDCGINNVINGGTLVDTTVDPCN